jgi:hypothetical protein
MKTRQRTSTRTIVLWVVAAHVWLLALIGVCTGGLAVWREVTPPREYQRVVNQLAEYKAAHGHYPESLADAGIPIRFGVRNGSRIPCTQAAKNTS